MRKIAIIIYFLSLFLFTKGQDIWYVYQEFSPLDPTRGFDEWKKNVIYNEDITYYLLERGRDNNNIWEWRTEDYKFKYKNIPIEYAILKVHYENDRVRFINGEFFKEASFQGLDARASITEAFALEKAKEYIGAEQYIWESSEHRYLELTEQEYLKKPPRGELIICKNYMDTASTKLSLAYKFEIYATIPHSKDYVYVDAHTGSIIHVNSLIRGATGFAETRYSYTQEISTKHNGQHYILRDDSRGNGIETYNLRKGTDLSTAIDFFSFDNYWLKADFHNANKDDAALDAHWGAMVSYDYFKNRHGRNSYDGYGGKIKSYVHYGNNFNNAGWDNAAKVMIFGDGDNVSRDALTCLDIVAHEFAHGVTQHTAGLIYQGESGALSESISDIFAVCVENYACTKNYICKPFIGLWSIGEDITLQSTAMRYLWAPILGGQPSIYKGPLWHSGSSDNGGVHTNSGVFNFWFYLLTNGGSGINGNIPFSITGIGIEKAEKLVYRSLTQFFTPNTIYPIAALWTSLAAFIHFGACSPEVKSVIDAWRAVGIDLIMAPYQENLIITQTIPSGTTMAFGAINTIQATNIIQTNANVTYRAGDQITLSPGFEVKSGATFHAYIQPCAFISRNPQDISNAIDNTIDSFHQVSIDNQGNELRQNVILYPNPTHNFVHLSFVENNKEAHLSVYDIMGKELLRQTITDNKHIVDLSSFHSGVFLFKITSNEYNRTFKVIKQ
ncbi:MAG: M4 family metallopeptidase [Bacteroidetes bacterium]|nr:M4 family metallopeptidase [Bacteroidota bacterium]MCL2302130.1 M4 family metallopeptidase [Lentimicrobiaceae bacterium]